MNIDPKTIIVVNVVGSLLMSLGLWSASKGYFSSLIAVKSWSIATFMQAVGWFVLGVLRTIIPEWISIALGNTLLLFCLLYYYNIILVFFGKPPRLLLQWVLPLIEFGFLSLFYFSEFDQKFRVSFMSLLGSIALLLSAYEVLFAQKSKLISNRFTGLFFGICGFLLFVRSGYYAFFDIPKNQIGFGPSIQQNLMFLFFYITSVMMTFGFLLMCIDRFAKEQKENEAKSKLAEKKIRNYLAELQSLNLTKDKFFSILAHDLKGPIGGISSFASMILEDIESQSIEKSKRALSLLVQSSGDVYNLLENLLTWARSQTGEVEYNPTTFSAFQLIETVMSVLSFPAENKFVILENKIPISLTVYGDQKMLETVFRNLIANAIKYSKASDKIQIHLEDREQSILFIVEDNGIGMDEKIYRKLFQIDTKQISIPGTNGERGTGLGLILSNEFILRHGGKIWVESETGIGSKFFVELPKDYSISSTT
ncbi:HAMP domain-containing sensor histidine kinase [Leptospira sp. 96542]|nr:HAMP domain-containing sensor histidine kinase [Leptospira sp. 96542]